MWVATCEKAASSSLALVDPPSCEAYAGAEEGEEEEAAEDSDADPAEEDKAEVETAGPQEIW